MITKLILPDGSTLSSGTPGEAAILSFSHTAAVSAGQELEPGACCAAMIRVEIMGQTPIQSGMELAAYRDDRLLGRFIVKEAVRNGQTLAVTAYDRVTLLDQDLTTWLGGRTQWPVTVGALAEEVCAACGAQLEQKPDMDYSIRQFSSSFVTGRQLMQWIGQVCGCFCRATPAGTLELAWYTPTDKAVTAAGECFYYQGSLHLGDYDVKAVEQVRLAQSGTDVGVVWPAVTGQVNTLLIRGNPLLAAQTTADTEPVAQQLYERFKNVTYTPCTVTVGEESGICAGDIITVAGKTVYVMSAVLEQGRLRLSCTGSMKRSDSSTVTISSKELTGRVLELDTRIDGLTAENRDSAGKISRLSMTVDGLTASVSTQLSQDRQRLTKLEQSAEALSLQVRESVGQVVTDTGYTFDSDGLRIARTGTEMENRLDHSGMYVSRAGETILKATGRGVEAADVQVRNFLHIGSYARFEDHAGRTACFYIGE